MGSEMCIRDRTETVVADDDVWGEEDRLDKVAAPTKREFIITGAKGSSIDKTIYTEQNVTEAIAKIKNANKAEENFGDDSNDDWGDGTDFDDGDDEAWD